VLSEQDRAAVEHLGQSYREAVHGLRTASHSTALPDAFLDRFTVIGPASHCAERLNEFGSTASGQDDGGSRPSVEPTTSGDVGNVVLPRRHPTRRAGLRSVSRALA
jgi:hypothetical protein